MGGGGDDGSAGAIGGPLLLAPAVAAAPGYLGPLMVAAVACALAALAARAVSAASATGVPPVPVRTLVTRPAIRTAASVLVTAQVVMAAVMTAAPPHLHHHGSSLTAIGLALSAHTVGMFAFAPLTGRLTDRVGERAVMLAGLAGMGAAAATIAAGVGAPALFALGLGWNLCFVAGSSRLARDVPTGERMQVEGAVDAVVWVLAAAAGLGCTLLLTAAGFGVLATLSGVLVLPAAALVISSATGPAHPAGDRDASESVAHVAGGRKPVP
ncbi:MFS transporter [Dactylosporangium sp. AC04546]|uniref:MFS transporter n=1 Tax=Dactylosporangium sp. AC04546 TaxID=2862460 RepID=UPI001EDEE0DE|nr:MFS transporter [Dactylosporangium sp. AC04546]WVK88363.1 MFS transporter [Dactylosporangium sp. AC04546]